MTETETETTTATTAQTATHWPSISAQNRKRLLILTLGPALGSLAMWLGLWFPVNLAYGQADLGTMLHIIETHSLLINIGVLVYVYDRWQSAAPGVSGV
jgi:hypothetical protein